MDSLYEHAAFYGMLHDERASDLPFYLETTAGHDRVLEYGVGRGRVALPMARRGQQVLGVDDSAPMLAALTERLAAEPPPVRARVRTRCGDARSLVLDERFDAVTCPFNGICHHHDLGQLGAFLHHVRLHLEPDGVFVFDVAVPNPLLLAGTTSDVPWFRDPGDGVVCRATEHIEYDALRQILTVTTTKRPMEGDAEPVEMVLRMRQLFPAETLLLLQHHGWRVIDRRPELGDVIGYVCRPA